MFNAEQLKLLKKEEVNSKKQKEDIKDNVLLDKQEVLNRLSEKKKVREKENAVKQKMYEAIRIKNRYGVEKMHQYLSSLKEEEAVEVFLLFIPPLRSVVCSETSECQKDWDLSPNYLSFFWDTMAIIREMTEEILRSEEKPPEVEISTEAENTAESQTELVESNSVTPAPAPAPAAKPKKPKQSGRKATGKTTKTAPKK